MFDSNDWRLTGQDRFLTGAVLHYANWTAPRPDWDHDHCEFCWAKFMSQPGPEILTAGYTTADSHHWICPTCFADFRDQFGWKLENA